MTVTIQTSPFLQRQRNFPVEDLQVLGVEIDKTYIDIASRVNERTIGIYATNIPIQTGESWYFTGNSNKQQTLRQVYSITSYAAFNHGINFSSVSTFTVIRGIGYDGTNYFPLPYVSGAAVANQVGLLVTPTQVTFSNGAGAPVIKSGFILLEWLSIF
jgi:hypothetical protein